MPQSNVTTWLQFALQQMAAESYLDGFSFSNTNELIRRLKFGNNNASTLGLNNPDEIPNLPGKTRLTSIQAQQFVERYQIIDHHANDASGFSATLMKDTTTGEYTLSFRSTEYQNPNAGGDFARDALGADADIFFRGFAFGQLVAMEQYYKDLKASGTLPPGAVLNVTGNSLGGHLASVFTEVHAAEVQHAYTFNGIGRGHITGGTEATEDARIAGMLNLFRAVLLDPDAGLTVIGDNTAPDYVAAKALHDQETTTPFTPFVSETSPGAAGNLYTDARYQWAVDVVRTKYTTSGTIGLPPPGEVGAGVGFDKITQLFGHADHNDSEYVANRGVHGAPTSVFIEDQPNLDGFGGFFGLNGDFGTSHSVILIVDALALMETFQAVDPNVTQTSLEQMFSAASNQIATGTTVGLSGTAEADSLENALDALRKVFLGPVEITDSNPATGGFGDLTFRNPFYQNIATLTAAAQAARDAGAAYTITPLTSFNAATIANAAETDVVQGLAYRYALKELNPFAVLGADLARTSALYAQHNVGGALELETEGGILTSQYLKDRAEFLEEKILVDVADAVQSSGAIHFVNKTTNYEITTTADPTTVREFVFGSDTGETIAGNSNDDHLFGAGGNDTLTGNGGADYLEGGPGQDVLDGGAGVDTLVGGGGDDKLTGGPDNDMLDGGTGHDTYVYRLNDGLDTIRDSDGNGGLFYDNQLVQGGFHNATDLANTYRSTDGTFTFVKAGSDLVINNLITIKDFAAGEFRIALTDLPDYAANGLPTQGPTPPLTEGNDSRTLSGAVNFVAHALGGNDFITGGFGNDQLFGDAGFDTLNGGQGHDRLFGGVDGDALYGDDLFATSIGGDDFLDGGDGSDTLNGNAGADVLLGGAGNDALIGDDSLNASPSGHDDDVLDGGDGNDTMNGGFGNDILAGGNGNDFLLGDDPATAAALHGNDSLDGGAGDDELYGLGGTDVLAGDAGNDVLQGGAGADVLYGDAGTDVPSGSYLVTGINDTVYGGDGDDRLYGGALNDRLFGDGQNSPVDTGTVGGNDVLDGGDGNDDLRGGQGDDVLLGGAGADSLIGDDNTSTLLVAGDDTLDGGDGNDFLYGNGGADILFGGAGHDLLWGDYNLNLLPSGSPLVNVGGNDTLDGGDGNDGLDGGVGNDVLHGGTGNDSLVGGDGIDQLFGDDGNDSLKGEVGDDTLDGGAGNDSLEGGAGVNVLVGGEGDDTLDGSFAFGVSVDTLDGGLGNDTYRMDDVGDTVLEAAGAGTDTIISAIGYTQPFTLQADVENFVSTFTGGGLTIIGNDADNVLSNVAVLFGGEVVFGGPGNILFGGLGNDTLTGGLLDGGPGNDILQNDPLQRNTRFEFGRGSDQDLVVGGGQAVLMAADVLPGNVAATRQGENLVLSINGATDQLTVHSFFSIVEIPDSFYIGAHTNTSPGQVAQVQFSDGTVWTPTTFGSTQLGGREANTYHFGRGDGQQTILDFDWERFSDAQDVLQLGAGVASTDLTLEKQDKDLVVTITGTQDQLTVQSFFARVGITIPVPRSAYFVNAYQIEQVRFADGTVWDVPTLQNHIQVITGTDQNDILAGFGNDNVLRGLGGNDQLDGGGGNDTLEGGPGDDTYIISTGDSVVENPNEGTDTIQSVVTHTLEANVENLTLVGGSSINGTGNALDNVLIGNQNFAANVLTGGAGNDTYAIGFGDTVIENANEGTDTVQSSVTHTLGTDVENLTLTGSSAINGTGNVLDNVLTGNSAANALAGNAGNDTLTGGAGADSLIGGAGDDVLQGEGNDELDGDGGNDTLYCGAGNDDVAECRYLLSAGCV